MHKKRVKNELQNILINKLPNTVIIGDAEIKINTDFRICLKCILAFEDDELTDSDKIYVMLKLLYDDIPDNKDEAITQAVWFLNCGVEPQNNDTNEPRLYSFEKDNRYIYVAMKQSLNVDFDNLHWWDFVNYFMALDEKSFFSRMLYLRKQKQLGKLTKEEMEYYNEHRDILELDDEVIDDEAVINFKNLLKKGG